MWFVSLKSSGTWETKQNDYVNTWADWRANDNSIGSIGSGVNACMDWSGWGSERMHGLEWVGSAHVHGLEWAGSARAWIGVGHE